MKKIQILGTGCARCQKLTDNAEAAAKELGIAYEIEKIKEIEKIVAFGVMTTPALAVNGSVKVVGKVPSLGEIKCILQQAAD